MVRALLVMLLLSILPGCGGGPSLVQVTGTVTYPDGTVPKGEIATITFQPASGGPDTKAASGKIHPDGSFTLETFHPGDGAKPGDYLVTVHVMQGYPAGRSQVAQKFTKPNTTPLKATVDEDGANKFDFVVERP